ncbi:hypothetical protein Acsp03_32290 [Actinomadura sp. NBRC 104412]|uniref:DUF1707 and DUF4870 domain-containing protein n=1 Tax=Actinomadura sp. NBRC 104412 TaxID=3032203 RepID=UPI0024A465C4|nr:DUF1707 and DUF4870 domain-containing protein [Actinomadura sp. NBRC 104412]GLZ05763.1 hypothetical protein Acsp03_32290 [Actinomadura sp. NBRC 104412]
MNGGYTAPELRVSDAERDQVVERLQEAYAEGRLEHDEFDMRMHLAMTSKTRGDLAAVTRDLAPVRSVARPPSGSVTGEDRMLAALAHGAGIATLFVGPLVLMLTSGKRSAYVRRHAVEAVNFQLTLLLVTIVTFGIGAIVYAVSWAVAAVAAVVGLTGAPFRYPWILRLVK